MDVCGLITLTTDFGGKEPYAGILKGMIFASNQQARIIDITHEIPPHDIINAAFTLVRAYEYFPPGTVHVAVIDPEVGGNRINIAVQTDRYFFVGPDNGIFTIALAKERKMEIREIRNAPFIFHTISSTFHGRDVYAPCAGALSAGKDFSDVGPVVKRLKSITYPKITQNGNMLNGEIVSIDSFGNLITNITRTALKSFAGKRKIEIYFGAERFNEIKDHYSEVPKGTPLALFGSSGFLEISMNEGNAASYFMVSTGNTIAIRRS